MPPLETILIGLVTPWENIVARGVNSMSAIHARQTHCLRGHEFTPENIYYRKDKHGRQCRACARIRDAKRRPRAA